MYSGAATRLIGWLTRFSLFRLRALQEEYFDRLNPEDFRKMQALESPLKTASKVAGKGQKSKNVVKTVWDEVRGWPRLNTETCVLMDPEVKKNPEPKPSTDQTRSHRFLSTLEHTVVGPALQNLSLRFCGIIRDRKTIM